MSKTGRQWIGELRKRFIIFSAGRVFLLSLGFALLVTALSFHFFQLQLIPFLSSFIFSFLLLSVKSRYWAISEREVSRYVDLHIPEAEDSSGLLLKPLTDLSFLEKLQVQKVNEILSNYKQPSAPLNTIKAALVFLVFSILISVVLVKIPKGSFSAIKPAAAVSKPVIKENIPVQVSSFRVDIRPPLYTGKSRRSQKQFSITAESGAKVDWEIITSDSLKNLSFIFNDHQLVKLKNTDHKGNRWSLSMQLFKPGFYQLLIDGRKSDFYQVEIIADQPVAIKIIKPEQHSTIDVGRPQTVNLNVFMQDDYGISTAYISATMASGKGEAVSFKEKRISFNKPFNGAKEMNLNQQIFLKEMGMKPGDELYFYINATDNRGQVSRSDMYFVSIQDTTELMSMAGIDNGVNLVPEYFRSERQIIIDIEKLLKEKAAVPETEFKTRSNDLGADQKMLRLRYGKFLGEESEASIGGAHEEEHDHKEEHAHTEEKAPVGNVQSIMDQYAHVHDNAEDASFFEPQLKAQLKATLTEMWNAELRLRTYKPEEALPYAYKALRLLKDLQQKSRAYVAKTTFKTSTIKPEKRLTGELTEINAGINTSKTTTKDNSRVKLEQAISILENRKQTRYLLPQDLNLLLQAQRSLLEKAAIKPAAYLPPLKAIKKVIAAKQGTTVAAIDIELAEKGINSLLGQNEAHPFPQTNSSSSALTRSYFNHLKRKLP